MKKKLLSSSDQCSDENKTGCVTVTKVGGRGFTKEETM